MNLPILLSTKLVKYALHAPGTARTDEHMMTCKALAQNPCAAFHPPDMSVMSPQVAAETQLGPCLRGGLEESA